jgi:hypothetical protein
MTISRWHAASFRQGDVVRVDPSGDRILMLVTVV